MRRYFGLMFLSVAMLVIPVVILGCATRVRVYDEEHRDYHAWNHGEVMYYQRWEAESHRDHKDFNHRTEAEKKEYWNWRHTHGDNDHH